MLLLTHPHCYCNINHVKKGVLKLKLYSFAATKGGVGKTTLCYNFGEYLAATGKTVLLIDLDSQLSLTSVYNVQDDGNNIGNVFKADIDEDLPVTIHRAKDNIALIAGCALLDEIGSKIENDPNKNMKLFMWLGNHYDEVNQYDYILFDCPPAFSTITKNAIVNSHVIINPLTPSQFSFDAKAMFEQRIARLRKEVFNFERRTSYVTAELYFVENMVKHNTNSSHEMQRVLAEDKNVIGVFPYRELFNRSTLDRRSLSEMEQLDGFKKYQSFVNEVTQVFEKMANI